MNERTQQAPIPTSDRHWEQIITWQRQGLVSIKPTGRDRARVEVTDKGREAA